MSIGIRAWSHPDSRTDIVALPSCQLSLVCSKPKSYAYPRELRTIGDHLRKHRLDLSLHQVATGQRIGVCCSTVSLWEKGRSRPHLRHMPAIIEFLGYDPTPEAVNLSERLVRYRRGRGWTQDRFARKLCVDPTTLARWERGERVPRGDYRAKLEAVLVGSESV